MLKLNSVWLRSCGGHVPDLRRHRRERDRRHGGPRPIRPGGPVLAKWSMRTLSGRAGTAWSRSSGSGRWKFRKGWTKVWSCERHA